MVEPHYLKLTVMWAHVPVRKRADVIFNQRVGEDSIVKQHPSNETPPLRLNQAGDILFLKDHITQRGVFGFFSDPDQYECHFVRLHHA